VFTNRFAALGGFFIVARERIAALRDRMPDFGPWSLSRALAFASILFMVSIIGRDLIGPTPANSSVTRLPERPLWSEITRAHGAFALESPALEGLELSYLVRRHRVGGGRKDLMTWGSVDGDGAYMRVVLYRPGTESAFLDDPLDIATALAVESGIDAELSGPAGELKTKFGDLPIVNMHTWGKNGPRACMVVAHSWSEPRLSLVAWWCNRDWQLVQRGHVACLMDRLMLMSAGGDGKLAAFFARAERERETCGTTPILGTTPKRPDDWIFAKAEPQLRGRLGGR
jgi:hypothetical protein